MKRKLLCLLLAGMAFSQMGGSSLAQRSEPELAWKFGELLFSPEFYPVVRDGRVYYDTPFWNGGPFIFELESGKEIWRGGEYITSPPVIDCNYMIFPSSRGLICLSLETKEPLWVSKVPGNTTSPPVVTGRKVLVTTGSYFTSFPEMADQDLVLCYDKLTGDMLWKFKGEGKMNSMPVVYGNMVLASSTEGNLYALDLESGGLLWKVETGTKMWKPGGMTRIYTTIPPVIWGDRVLFACRKLYCLDLDGTILWEMNANLVSGISLSPSERRLYGRDGYDVVSIDLEKREVVWRYPNREREVSTDVSGSRLHFFGTEKGDICCLSSDGELLWKYHIDNKSFSAPSRPILSEGYLLMTSYEGDIYTFKLPGEWCYIEAEGLFADGKYREAQGFYVKALEYYEEKGNKEMVDKIKQRIATTYPYTEESCAEWQNAGEKGIRITSVIIIGIFAITAVTLIFVVQRYRRS